MNLESAGSSGEFLYIRKSATIIATIFFIKLSPPPLPILQS